MAYVKSEFQAKDLIKGDVFRLVECVGNLRQTFEYEVVSVKLETVMMHVGDSGLKRAVEQAVVKVKNRRNGAGKTKKFDANCLLTVWRKEV